MRVVDLGINGEGVARENGKVFFVKGALVDEEISVKNVEEKNKFCVCEVDKITEKSKDRIEPKCPYFMVCGGCQLQHLEYSKQLEYKSKLVKDTLRKVGYIDCEVLPCIPSKKEFNYRCKNVFPVFLEKGHSCLGMFKENTNDVIKIDKCLIANEEINKVLEVTNEFFKDKKVEGLRYIVVKSIDKKLLITLVTEKKELPFLKKYVQTLQIYFKDFSLNLNINHDRKNILSDTFIQEYGEKEIRTTTLGIKHTINAGSFIQVNADVKLKLYEDILKCFDKNDIVVDAYCGAGLLSAMLAQKVKYCYGVEISKDAIQSANNMQRENEIENLFFINGNCDKEIPSLFANIEDDFTVVLDPPRKGCSDNVLKGIIEVKPSKVVYVSCNPITLSTDLKKLVDGGYKIQSVQPYDMFPQTVNVETLVVLKK